MKRNLFFPLITAIVMFSCSKDENKQEDVDPAGAIVGSWRATEFKAADPNSTSLNLPAEILKRLTAEIVIS